MSFWKYEKSLPMPSLIRQWTRLIEWSIVGLIAGYIIHVLFFRESAHWLLFVLPVGFLIPLLQIGVLRPILKRARRANLRICEHCGHPFEGDEPQQCEACQEAIHPEETRRLWRTAVLRYHRGGSRAKIPTLKPWRVVFFCVLGGIAPFTGAFLIVWFVTNTSQGTNSIPSGIGLLLALTMFPLQWIFFGIAGLYYFGALRKQELAHQHDFLLCDRCLFPLNDIPDTQACPECGSAFQRDDLRRRWYENWARKKNFREAVELDIPLMIRDDAKA